MTLDILKWTFRKYKVFCLITYVFLAICLLGYLALIWYWSRKFIKMKKMKKKKRAMRKPADVIPTTSTAIESIPEVSDSSFNMLEPAPLNKRRSPVSRKRRRSSSYDKDFDENDIKVVEPSKKTFKSPRVQFVKTKKNKIKISDRLKQNRPEYKQYLFM